jgi:hypothetical protein
MKNIDDEVLNDYLDGHLSESELAEVKIAIESNPVIKSRYEALLAAHKLFGLVSPDMVSNDFEKRVLQRINKRKEIAKQQKRFMMMIFSFFGLLLFSIVGYAFTEVLSSIKLSASENIISTFSVLLDDYQKFLSNKNNLTILGSILSFIMLLSGYFLFELQKKSKRFIG